LVIATGASYCGPWRDKPEVLSTYESRKEEFATVRKAINEAPSILCVGAGPTGLETAGYLKERFPDKTVGVALRGKTLLPSYNGGHDKTEVLLKELGIQIKYETPY